MPKTYTVHGLELTQKEMAALYAEVAPYMGRVKDAPGHIKFIAAMLYQAGYGVEDVRRIAEGTDDA